MSSKITLTTFNPIKTHDVSINFDGTSYGGFLRGNRDVGSYTGTFDECIRDLYKSVLFFEKTKANEKQNLHS